MAAVTEARVRELMEQYFVSYDQRVQEGVRKSREVIETLGQQTQEITEHVAASLSQADTVRTAIIKAH